MTDIVEEARAMLAESAKRHPQPWSAVSTIVWDDRGSGVAAAVTMKDAALIAAAPRLLAALADECERLRAENARLREAMPTDAEIASIGNVAYQARRAGASTTHTDAWLARVDAARAKETT